MGFFKKVGKGFKKLGQGVSKALSKVLPVAKLATAIIPGGKLVDNIIDKSAAGLQKLGGPMRKVKKVKTLVGALGVNTNLPQTVHPLQQKAAHPRKAVGALSMNHYSGSWRTAQALNNLPSDDEQGLKKKDADLKPEQASMGGIGICVLILIILGAMFGKKKT